MATQVEVDDLASAMWQLLDDMKANGGRVCLAAKAQARLAFEPFRRERESEYGTLEELDDWMTVAEAEQIEREAD